jgi:predicted ArsR family transcriptional regulator
LDRSVDPIEGTVVHLPPRFYLLSNHGHVLVAVATNTDARVREIADRVGITERTTLTILNDLVDAGYVQRTRIGRRNAYTVDRDRPFPHPALRQHSVESLLHSLALIDSGAQAPRFA